MTHGNEPRRRRRPDSSRHPEPDETEDWLAGYRPSNDERDEWSFRARADESPMPRDHPAPGFDVPSPRSVGPPPTGRGPAVGEPPPTTSRGRGRAGGGEPPPSNRRGIAEPPPTDRRGRAGDEPPPTGRRGRAGDEPPPTGRRGIAEPPPSNRGGRAGQRAEQQPAAHFDVPSPFDG
ncbi:MAG: hypothetical protein KJO75_06630, partial [Dactylosporangium sp.]|nr:hypothetical protein [Dactylosporangium sp.]